MRSPATTSVPGNWYALALDEVDYAALLVRDDGLVVHANRLALAELDDQHPLQLQGGLLRTPSPQDAASLQDALTAAAQRGLRRLLVLGEGARRVHASIVPLGSPARGALVLLSRRSACETLSIQWFARAHHLTPTEERVLGALCRGLLPTEICELHGVGMATVRSQIRSIRQKTGASGLRALTEMVARLPPMMGVLRPSSPAPAATIAAWPPTATHLN